MFDFLCVCVFLIGVSGWFDSNLSKPEYVGMSFLGVFGLMQLFLESGTRISWWK